MKNINFKFDEDVEWCLHKTQRSYDLMKRTKPIVVKGKIKKWSIVAHCGLKPDIIADILMDNVMKHCAVEDKVNLRVQLDKLSDQHKIYSEKLLQQLEKLL